MSATVRFDNSSQAHLYTQRADNGNWYSYGFTSNLVGHDEGGSSRCEVVDSFQDYTEYSDSQTALDAAIYGFEEVKPWSDDTSAVAHVHGHCNSDECGWCISGVSPEEAYVNPSDDEYTGDVLPTGWDAQDHKALYE